MFDWMLERLAHVSPVLVLLCVAVPSTAIAVAVSASDTTSIAAVEGGDVSNRSVEAIRRATRRFSEVEAARQEGWTVEITPCMESEEGGMGSHFGRQALLEGRGALDPVMPEALPYRNGTFADPSPDVSCEHVGPVTKH